MPNSRCRRTSRANRRPRSSKGKEVVWWSIRDIISERLVNGAVEYLVAWEDDPVSGQSFEPTWSFEVTELALESWKAAKIAAVDVESLKTQVGSGKICSTQEDQSPLPNNWRKIRRIDQNLDAQDIRGGKQDLEFADYETEVNPEEPLQSPSPSSTASLTPSLEVDEAALNQELPFSGYSRQIVVELPKKLTIDLSDYLSVDNSQSSGEASQSVADQEAEDSRTVLAWTLAQNTIPDSQEDSGQWSSSQSVQGATIPSQVDIADSNISVAILPDFLVNTGNKPISTPTEDLNVIVTDSAPRSAKTWHYPTSRSPSPPGRSQFVESDGLDLPSRQVFSQVTTVTPFSTQQGHSTSAQSDVSQNREPIQILSHQPWSNSDPGEESGPRFHTQAHYTNTIVPEAQASTDGDDSWSIAATTAPLTASEGLHQLQTTHSQTVIQPSQAAQVVRKFDPPLSDSMSNSQEPRSGLNEQVLTKAMNSRDGSSARSLSNQPSAVDELIDIFDIGNTPMETTEAYQGPSRVFELSQVEEAKSTGGAVAPGQQLSDTIETSSTPVIPQFLHAAPGSIDLFEEPTTHQEQPRTFTLETRDSKNPAPSTGQLRRSATLELQDIIKEAFSPSPRLGATQLSHSAIGQTQGSDLLDRPLPSPLPSDFITDTVSDPLHSLSIPHDLTSSLPLPIDNQLPIEHHIVTLPFHASRRPFYDDTLLKYRSEARDFSTRFNEEIFYRPEESLIAKVDELFKELTQICDYPPDIIGTDLGELSENEKARYMFDSNPKFNFLVGFLNNLEKKQVRVLITARSNELLQLLTDVATSVGSSWKCKTLQKSSKGRRDGTLHLTIALSLEEDIDVFAYDVVIGFDSSFTGSPLARDLAAGQTSRRQPLHLLLVTAYSIEHIDRHVPEDLSALERKNFLLVGIAAARELVAGHTDTDCPEPHIAARIFANYVNGYSDEISWLPAPLPDSVLDVYMSTQTNETEADELENDLHRKRKLDDSGDDETAKRPRASTLGKSTVQAKEPPLPEEVKKLRDAWNLDLDGEVNGIGQVRISVKSLVTLAEQIAEKDRQIDLLSTESESTRLIETLDMRLKEYERTSAKIYQTYRSALEDRAKFASDQRKAQTALESTKEAAASFKENASKKLVELQATIARLSGASDGDGTPLSKTERLLQETSEAKQTLEKRLINAHKDAEYMRNLLQEANSTVAQVRSENQELQGQNTILQRRADSNLVRIHEIQAEDTSKIQRRQVEVVTSQLKDREHELDRAREEVKQLRSSRRDTRQVSVPRSPRMGMSSPRHGRFGSSASRGTSPALPDNPSSTMPSIQFMAQQAANNGRFQHLRE